MIQIIILPASQADCVLMTDMLYLCHDSQYTNLFLAACSLHRTNTLGGSDSLEVITQDLVRQKLVIKWFLERRCKTQRIRLNTILCGLANFLDTSI